ncbi:restriction endonuclease subunit S [Anaerobutyricum hallii]|uniref:restriction endonuclease subunit S n=1 Tax=Anaerobutyricum hallii TaxID=39488 RepID=UPI00351F90EF
MNEPKLRFKADDGSQFPDWKEKKIGDLFYKVNERNNGQFGKDKWISVAKMYYQDEDKVTSNNIDTRTYVMRIGDMAFEGHPNKEFKYGRFVVNDIGDGIISELFPIYRHKGEYVLKYWKYAIQIDTIMQKIYRKAITSSGASSNKLDNNDFENQSIPVPCLEEQQKIAEFLSTVDTVIEKQKETVSAWEERKKGVMQKLFSQEVRFKADDGSDFPEWEEKKLGDIGTAKMCKRVLKEQTGEKGDIPFFKIGTFGGVPDAFISRELYEELKSKYSFPRKGNILISAAGTIGRTVVYDGEDAFFQDSNIVWLDTENTIILDSFLLQFYNQTSWDNLEGGTIKRLYNGLFLSKSINLPCLAEQQKIADCLSSFDEVIEKQKATLVAWEEMKKGLLQQMFV